jgi:hypothetical protein
LLPPRGRTPPAGSASGSPKRAGRRESAPHTGATGESSNGLGRRTIRGCSSKSCVWQLLVVRICVGRPPSPQGGGTGPAGHEEPDRAVDADAGGARGDRVRDVRLRGRIRERASSRRASAGGTIRRQALRAWRRTPLTGQVSKRSGSSGQLDGVRLPQGRPGRAPRKRRYITAATGRCMEPMRRCLVNDRERQRSVRLPGKAPPVAKQRGAGGRHRSHTIPLSQGGLASPRRRAWRTRCIGTNRPKRAPAKAALSPHS